MFVINFEVTVISKSNWFQTLAQKGCVVKSPTEFLNVTQLDLRQNVLIWMVDNTDYLIYLVNHWDTNAMKCTFLSDCFVATKSSLSTAITKRYPIRETLKAGIQMIDVTNTRQVTTRLRYGIQIRHLVPQPSLLKGESLSPSGKTLCFQGRVHYTPVVVLLDTGASHCFINETFLDRINVKFNKVNDTAMAVNAELSIVGQVKLSVSFGGFQTMASLYVTDIAQPFSAILGYDWLVKHKAILYMETHSCSLRKGSSKYMLTTKPTLSSPHTTRIVVNGIRFQKALTKGCRGFRVILNLVTHEARETSIEDEHDNDVEWGVADLEKVPTDIQPLLEEYGDVFPDELPRGLPMVRQVGHTIPLVEGAKPTFRPIYRLSPKEHSEVRQQITDLLDKGWITPSRSPFGAPILFVQKKDGSLRMCVDYRALNQQTIKNRYALPRIDDLMDQLVGSKYFSSLDLAQGYHQIRISDDDVEKTAFRTPIGHYEYRVMPFGLTNAPATFQSVMNDVFREYLGKFVLVYLDDILVYSKTKDEHIGHLEIVLDLLRKHKFYAKLRKCQFLTKELLYLGHIISDKGVQPDPQKIAALGSWQKPTNVHEVRSFLGFGNYFRKFVQGYSKLVLPLTTLTKKGVPFTWTRECTEAFQGVIWNLTNAPTLKLADPKLPYEVICDASNVALGAVLMQEGHPIAFESRRLTQAEQGYTVGERELLAIIHALRVWRCYLEGCQKLTIVTDHKPISYLDVQQMLSRRQARWAEFLARFDYELAYRPGRVNVADPLSRLRNPTNASPRAGTTGKLEVTGLGWPPNQQITPLLATIEKHVATIVSTPNSGKEPPVNVLDWIRSVSSLDPLFPGCLVKRKGGATHTIKGVLHDGLWYEDGRILVPDCKELREYIISESHDPPYRGHFGVAKTLAAVGKDFAWPNLAKDVKAYVTACHSCQVSKSLNLKPAGKLMPLPIPARKWDSVSMDFIMELPLTPNGHDALLVFVDRFSKMVHLVPTQTTVSALDTAKLYINNVFRHHGFQTDWVSDRDPRFTSDFWTEVCKLVGTKVQMSTAFHPQSDGQTERVNRVVEELLRAYVTPSQSNWDELLPLVEYAINNSKHTSTQETPFYLNSGQHPLNPLTMGSRGPSRTVRTVGKSRLPAAETFVKNIHEAVHQAKMNLKAAQDRQKAYADENRREVQFAAGDKVLLKTKHLNIKTTGVRKLLPKWIGPFPVVKKVGQVAYKLGLPDNMRCHPVFHVSLLHGYKTDGRVQPPPLPVEINDELEYEVEAILLHRDVKRGKRSTREYLVKWLGYGPEHNSWEPDSGMHCDDLIARYWDDKHDLAQRVKERDG